MNPRESDACLKLVHHFTGCDLNNEFLCRAVISNTRRRMQTLKIPRLSRYIRHLAGDPDEFLLFLSNSTIHTTYWFREEKHFELLRRQILARGISFVEIKCLACSTGEEAYSMAFVLENMVRAGEIEGFRIDASDIDIYSVRRAERGRYNTNGISRFIDDFSAFYQIDGQQFEINSAIRERIQFSRQNLLELPLESSEKFHFVFCRNVLIYFDFLSIKKIMAMVLGHLRDDGLFVIGHCESLDLGRQDSFRLVSNSMYLKAVPGVTVSERRKRKQILCVDDSEAMLKILEKRLNRDFDVMCANSAAAADALMEEHSVDHIILDINMPVTRGDEFLRDLRRRRVMTPVLLLSEISEEEAQRVVGSLFQENVDCLNKSRADRDTLFQKLSVSSYAPRRYQNNFNIKEISTYQVDALLVGGSTGAIPVIKELLESVRRPHLPIVVLEHMEPRFMRHFAASVSEYLGSPLVVPEVPVPLENNKVYMAAAERHLFVFEDAGAPMLRYSREGDGPVDGHRPSISFMFSSAARTPFRFAAFLLTGMGRDGAQGLLELRQRGSFTFTQDEESCVVYGMPKVAADLKANMHSGNPTELAAVFKSLAENVNPRVAARRSA